MADDQLQMFAARVRVDYDNRNLTAAVTLWNQLCDPNNGLAQFGDVVKAAQAVQQAAQLAPTVPKITYSNLSMLMQSQTVLVAGLDMPAYDKSFAAMDGAVQVHFLRQGEMRGLANAFRQYQNQLRSNPQWPVIRVALTAYATFRRYGLNQNRINETVALAQAALEYDANYPGYQSFITLAGNNNMTGYLPADGPGVPNNSGYGDTQTQDNGDQSQGLMLAIQDADTAFQRARDYLGKRLPYPK